MKRIFLLSFMAAAILVSRGLWAAEVLERIVAVVNDEIVTEQDLEYAMAPVTAQYRTLYAGSEFEEKLAQARRDFLDKVIEDKLILSEAKRKQVIVKDAEIDDLLADVRNKFPSREAFLKALEDQGMTEKKLRSRFADQLTTQKLVSYEVKSKVSVSPGEINEYYKAHPDEFAQGDRIRLQHILIRIGPHIEEDAKSFAESLVERIHAGESFEELARSYSEGSEAKEGGEMGWVTRGQLLGEIDEQVFSLSEGEITPPIHTSLGYHIFKVVQVQKFAVKPISDVRDDIYEKLFKMKLQERLEKWVASLKKNAYISIR